MIPTALTTVDTWQVFVNDMSGSSVFLCRWSWNPVQCSSENKVKPWTESGLSAENLLTEIQQLFFYLKKSEDQTLIWNDCLKSFFEQDGGSTNKSNLKQQHIHTYLQAYWWIFWGHLWFRDRNRLLSIELKLIICGISSKLIKMCDLLPSSFTYAFVICHRAQSIYH